MSSEKDSELAMDIKNSAGRTVSGAKMAAVVLVDAADMKEYVVHLNEENAKRAATDVTYALALLNAEKAKQSKTNTEASSVAETANSTSMVTSPTSQDDGSFRWNYVETEYLIREYRRLQPLFNSGRVSHKKCWTAIAEALNKEGVAVTASQCISKYRTLKRTYKAIKQHADETGQARMWRFYSDVESLLANDPVEKAATKDSSTETEKKTDSSLNLSNNDWPMDTDSSVEAVESLEQELGLTDDGEEPHRWSHEAIMLLIEEAIQVRPLCESGIVTQRKCWDRVATELTRRGFTVTGRQCLTKFNCLRRTYRSIFEYNARVERGEVPSRCKRLDWKYYDIVGRLLEDSWTYSVNNGKNREESKTTSDDDIMIVDPDGSTYSLIETLEENNFEPHTFNSDNSSVKQNGVDVAQSSDRETSGSTSSQPLVRKATRNDESNQVEEPTWCDKSTRLLIGEYKERKNMADLKGVNGEKTMWSMISDTLKKNGFPFNAAQVEDRWKALQKAFRFFGSGKSSATVRIAPYYAELRKILGKRPVLISGTMQNSTSPSTGSGKFVLRRGVLVAKPPIRTASSGPKASTSEKSPTSSLPATERTESPTKSNRAPTFPIISSNQLTDTEEVSTEQDRDRQRSRLRREHALVALRELKEELAKQTRELERHAKQKEAYCQKIIEQNEIMIKQRDRRNDLLEELTILRRQELTDV